MLMNLALRDLKEALKLIPAAWFLTWSDTQARYRRSVLGPFWLVLGTAIGVAGLGFLWSTLLKMDRAVFIPSLTVGLIVWQFISGCIVESVIVFIKNAMTLRNLKLPFLFFPLQLLFRHLINFLHNALIIIIVLLIYPPHDLLNQLLLIPGFILLIGNLFWIIIMIGILGARLRDLEPLIAAFMPLLFFMSPVIYRPANLHFHQIVIWLNPFAYFITLIRDPIEGVMPSAHIYIVSLLMLILGWTFTLYFLNKKYNRLTFWI
jgi:ABC-type polysaccharide/polyol phosphate export permease